MFAGGEGNAVGEGHDGGGDAVEAGFEVVFGFHGVGEDVFDPGLVVGDDFGAGVFEEERAALADDVGEAGAFGDGFVGGRGEYPEGDFAGAVVGGSGDLFAL